MLAGYLCLLLWRPWPNLLAHSFNNIYIYNFNIYIYCFFGQAICLIGLELSNIAPCAVLVGDEAGWQSHSVCSSSQGAVQYSDCTAFGNRESPFEFSDEWICRQIHFCLQLFESSIFSGSPWCLSSSSRHSIRLVAHSIFPNTFSNLLSTPHQLVWTFISIKGFCQCWTLLNC